MTRQKMPENELNKCKIAHCAMVAKFSTEASIFWSKKKWLSNSTLLRPRCIFSFKHFTENHCNLFQSRISICAFSRRYFNRFFDIFPMNLLFAMHNGNKGVCMCVFLQINLCRQKSCFDHAHDLPPTNSQID